MNISPTQITHPWITTARTVLQVIVGAVLWLFGIIVALATVAPQILAAVAEVLPPEWVAWLAGAIVFLGALAGAITKLMAIPAVNARLGRLAAPNADLGNVSINPQPTAEQQAALDEKAKALAQ